MLKLIVVVLLFLSGCTYPGPTTPTAAPYPMTAPQMDAPAVNPYPGPEGPVTFPDGTLIIFPVFNSRPLRGTEVWEGTAAKLQTRPLWDELQPDFVKLPVYWSHVEIAQDVYAWPSSYDLDVAYLRSLGILPVLTVKMAPGWARPTGSKLCARPTNISDYAEFVAAVAARYPGPLAIEIWNEPDTDLGAADWYGCWGDPAEPYYGGLYYRDVLDAVYPAIKAANPEALVIAGALTLPDNHPMRTYPQAWADSPNYDALSFHHYPIDSDPARLDAAITYLRTLTDRPLWLTETAVIAGNCTPAHEQLSVEWAQAVRADWRLSAVAWFMLQPSGWYCVDLLRSDWSRKPVYEEWRR